MNTTVKSAVTERQFNNCVETNELNFSPMGMISIVNAAIPNSQIKPCADGCNTDMRVSNSILPTVL